MKKQPINHLYVSETSPLRDVADALIDNLAKPVVVQDITALPAPDRQRPTRQQLRTERANVQRELEAVRNLIRLSEPYPRLADEVVALKQEAIDYQNRIQEIDAALGREGGVAA